jgi:hypothetical protein
MNTELAVVAGLLWLLATLDGGFAGFRDAAGRSLHLELRPMYARNIGRGLLVAQVVCFVSLGPVLAGIGWGGASLEGPFMRAGSMLVAFFGVYATVVLSSLSIHLVPDPDVSSLSTVLVLGPLTLLRPVAILVGWALALLEADLWCGLACTVGCGGMLATGWVLDRQWRDVTPMDARRH